MSTIVRKDTQIEAPTTSQGVIASKSQVLKALEKSHKKHAHMMRLLAK